MIDNNTEFSDHQFDVIEVLFNRWNHEDEDSVDAEDGFKQQRIDKMNNNTDLEPSMVSLTTEEDGTEEDEESNKCEHTMDGVTKNDALSDDHNKIKDIDKNDSLANTYIHNEKCCNHEEVYKADDNLIDLFR